MNVMALYLGALALFALSALLFWRNSFHTRSGGSNYERRMRLRFIGGILMAVSAILLGLGLLTQFFSNNAPDIPPPAISGNVADQPQSALATGSFYRAPSPPKSALPDFSALTQDTPVTSPADPVTAALMEAVRLQGQNKLDAALDKVNAVIQSAPRNANAYSLRGNIYAEKKLWDQAGQDYRSALQLDSGNIQAKFNLTEIDFVYRKYDDARPAFLALTKDSTMGDLANYKVFLCDLFGGHENVAASELAAFNQVGSNASYYFANVAWSLYHQKTEDARNWLGSARRIYPPNKFSLYAASLRDLGYLPLPTSHSSAP